MTPGMLPAALRPSVDPVAYPESDGRPMADNTKQARWIVVLFGNLSALFHTAADVFVALDLLWYPRQGEPDLRLAPDVLVVFGRPKGDRGSYLQWQEDNVPPTVVFEILSPGNSVAEMADKLAFYDEYGVEEYYVYDPDQNNLLVYVRGQAALRRVRHQGRYTSPRLGIHFDLSGPEMAVSYPNGRPFLSFEELEAERQRQQQRAEQAEQRAEREQQRAERSERELSRLRALSRKAVLQQASAAELQELQRLLAEGNASS